MVENKPQVERKKISDFTQDPSNANLGTERGLRALDDSLSQVGLGRSIVVDKHGNIIAGNKTTERAVDNGFEDAIVIKTDGKQLVVVQREDLDLMDISTENKARLLAYYDNRVAELDLRWNAEQLFADKQSGFNLSPLFSEQEQNELFASIDTGETQEPPQHTKLSDRFIVPPFSVLDARQGYWQERKQAWLSLGLQSELGRGVNLTDMSATVAGITDPEERAEWNSRRRNNKNGKIEAATYGAFGRTDEVSGKNLAANRKKNGKGLARTFAQDLMRGEHVVGAARAIHDHEWQKRVLGHIQANEAASGTSIFDPVLCELAYRWFSAEGAAILDPFAGGSVRGIVASKLNRHYTGVDLRQEQIEANIIQANDILDAETPEFVSIKISAKMARLKFNGCDPDYIRDVCHASCCQSSTSPTGTMITIHPSEIDIIEARGGIVKEGLLQPRANEQKCPFKTSDHLCGLHFTPDKPFGCIASPFTLNNNNTLIVRNRYRLLKCYDDGQKLPAYVAFRASLNLLFGIAEAERICQHLENGGGDIIAQMPYKNYQMLIDNDNIKHKRQDLNGTLSPQWITGDSLDIDTLASGEYDFIFTCPPYADLEIYSDDERDISNMDYPQFLEVYRAIIQKSCAMLKDNRFACIVVGDVRGKDGNYHNFVSDTIQAFIDSGLSLYNEAILVTALGSLPIRAGKQFEAGRKLGKTHQNVLVFLKGDSKLATEYCGEIDVYFPDTDSELIDTLDASHVRTHG